MTESSGKFLDGRVVVLVADITRQNVDAIVNAANSLNSLQLALFHSLVSLAFPAISTGIFGYPRPEAAAVASSAINDFLAGDRHCKEIRMVFFHSEDARIFIENQAFE